MSLSRIRTLALASALASLLAPGLSAAQPTPTPPPRDQSFTFGDELVQSSLRRPDLTTSRARALRPGPTLVRHRAHFVPEMLRSVEQL
jgi:hypothetical protein